MCFLNLLSAHLSLLHCHRLPPGCCLFVDAGQKVLGDPQGVLQERVVQMARGCVFKQVLVADEEILSLKSMYIQVIMNREACIHPIGT